MGKIIRNIAGQPIHSVQIFNQRGRLRVLAVRFGPVAILINPLQNKGGSAAVASPVADVPKPLSIGAELWVKVEKPVRFQRFRGCEFQSLLDGLILLQGFLYKIIE